MAKNKFQKVWFAYGSPKVSLNIYPDASCQDFMILFADKVYNRYLFNQAITWK